MDKGSEIIELYQASESSGDCINFARGPDLLLPQCPHGTGLSSMPTDVLSSSNFLILSCGYILLTLPSSVTAFSIYFPMREWFSHFTVFPLLVRKCSQTHELISWGWK